MLRLVRFAPVSFFEVCQLLRKMVTYMSTSGPRCVACDTVMIMTPTRPLMRIFGDVRAFECPTCNYMLLSVYPYLQPAPSEPAIVLRLDAAE
jgi:hypothetical protein